MNKITNTADEPVTLGTLFTAQPAGIEAQERRGQEELVLSSQLPAKINSPRLEDFGLASAKELYEKLGIEVVGASDGDGLFLDVRLPENWRLDATDHSMWSYLLDDKNRRRGSIFYKAAFYDRKSDFHLRSRYGVTGYEPVDEHRSVVEAYSSKHIYWAYYATDCEIPFHQIAARPTGDVSGLGDKHRILAKEYLNETFPDWENPFAYWD